MAYNHGREDRKWRIWKEAEEKLLRECGVDEVTIEQIRIADRADFNSNRRFYRWTNDVAEYLEDMADRERQAEVNTVAELLDEIESENLSFLVGKLVVLPPFSRGNTAFFKNAEDFLKFLQKFFERTKCARPKSPDGRIGIVSSIQMIRQFIYISVVSPGGGRAFFDKSITVGFCRYAFCFMAATSFSRRFQQ